MFLDSYSFTICDTSNFYEYVKGGVATEVKQPEILNFVSVTCY